MFRTPQKVIKSSRIKASIEKIPLKVEKNYWRKNFNFYVHRNQTSVLNQTFMYQQFYFCHPVCTWALPRTTDTRRLNHKFFTSQIQIQIQIPIPIPIPNKYLECGYKGLVFCRSNDWLMKNMDKGLAVPKWGLINRPKIPQKIYLPCHEIMPIHNVQIIFWAW